MNFETGFDFSSLKHIEINNAQVVIIASVLAIVGVLIYIKTVFFTEKEEFHQPGYMSNKKQKKIFRAKEYLISFLFVSAWCYVSYKSIVTNSIFVYLGSIEIFSVFLAAVSLISTFIFIFLMLVIFRVFLKVSFHLTFAASPLAIFALTQKFFPDFPYAYPIAGLLLVLVLLLYLSFGGFLNAIVTSISDISIVVLSNIGSIMKMFIPASLVLFFQIFVITSVFNSSDKTFSGQNIFLFLLLVWTLEIYSYFCRAFFASVTYLSLDKQSDTYTKSMGNTLKALPTLIYAALAPAFLLTLQNILSRISTSVNKMDTNLLIPVTLIIKALKALIFCLTYILKFYNDLVIPYIGVYGGGYSKATADKATSMKIDWSCKLLALPKVKDVIFFPAALIVGSFPFLLDYFSSSSVFGFSSIIEMFFSTSFSYGLSHVVFAINLKLIFIFFTVYVAYTFFICLQSALYARAFYEQDKNALKFSTDANLKTKADMPIID